MGLCGISLDFIELEFKKLAPILVLLHFKNRLYHFIGEPASVDPDLLYTINVSH